MPRPTGIDSDDIVSPVTTPELVFLSIFGRRLNENQLTELSKETVLENGIVPSFVDLIEQDEYRKYLSKVKSWSFKKMTTQQIVNLLSDPLRDKTGWIANGGTVLSKQEWIWMNS